MNEKAMRYTCSNPLTAHKITDESFGFLASQQKMNRNSEYSLIYHHRHLLTIFSFSFPSNTVSAIRQNTVYFNQHVTVNYQRIDQKGKKTEKLFFPQSLLSNRIRIYSVSRRKKSRENRKKNEKNWKKKKVFSLFCLSITMYLKQS